MYVVSEPLVRGADRVQPPLSLLPRGSTILAPSADRRLRTPGTLPALVLVRSRGD